MHAALFAGGSEVKGRCRGPGGRLWSRDRARVPGNWKCGGWGCRGGRVQAIPTILAELESVRVVPAAAAAVHDVVASSAVRTLFLPYEAPTLPDPAPYGNNATSAPRGREPR